MRLVVQRVLKASLSTGGKQVSSINQGLHVLCGITHGDNQLDIDSLLPKLLKLKLWDDKNGKAWASNVIDNSYQILFVSQFTLYHKLKGTKPDFHDAADHEIAKDLYEQFLSQLQTEYLKLRKETFKQGGEPGVQYVQPGSFGNHMEISTVCDGPVTLVIDSVKDPRALKKLEAM